MKLDWRAKGNNNDGIDSDHTSESAHRFSQNFNVNNGDSNGHKFN